MNVCTIIAKNYVAHARVLAASLAQHNPGARLQVLIIDDFSRHIDPAQEPFDVLTPRDIGCEPFMHMAMRYSILELSTAVKPWLLRHLMARSAAPVTYLDPDIKVFGSLGGLDQEAAEHGVVLTPHNAVPIPDDGRRPSQVDVMIAGVYNLGYVTVAPGPEVDQLLDWWADRLLRDCRVDPIWGYFVDQRWFDLVPGLLSDLAIVRDPEYNVAYWNLHSRNLALEHGAYLVDGRPLAFFHFSGFDPADPRVLSRHQNRIDVAQHPVLEAILAEYARDLHDAGHGTSRGWPYSFNALADGTALDEAVRALYDEYAEEHDDHVLSPFTLDGAREFEDWFVSQAPGAPQGISRVLACIYEQRPDLRSSFPDLWGSDASRLLEWASESGGREVPLLARVAATPSHEGRRESSANGSPGSLRARRLRGRPSPETGAQPRPFGVNLVADFQSSLEASELARQLLGALDGAGVPATPVQLATPRPGRERIEPFATTPAHEAPFRLNLLVVSPHGVAELGAHAGEGFFSGRYTVALCVWTATDLSEDVEAAVGPADEIWVPSQHVADLLQPLMALPVYTMTMPVVPRWLDGLDQGHRRRPSEDFVFVSSFDYRESFEALNPLGAVAAFEQEFTGSDRVRLIVNCRNADSDREAHGRLLQAAGDRPQIEVITDDLAPGAGSRLVAAADAYVSLHRETAFGVSMAEAMARGKPVLATGYSGNLEFMTETTGWLVDHELVPIPAEVPHYPEDALWAEPDLAHAGTLMRRLADDRDAARRLGEAGAQAITEAHGHAAALEALQRRLDSIRATGLTRPGGRGGQRRLDRVGKLSLQLRQGPVARPNAAGGAARESMRKAVLRVMQPYTAYQDTVNAAVLGAVEELCDAMAVQRDDAFAERAHRMAQARQHAATRAEQRAHDMHTQGMEMSTRLQELGSGVDHVKRLLTLQSDRSVYLALTELNQRHSEIGGQPGRAPERPALTPFELRVFSQNGEDGVLAEILRRTGAPGRFFVEFGVESGREGNCVYLADVAGWQGLFMDADRDFYAQLEQKYAVQHQIRTIQAMVEPDNVEALFQSAEAPEELDVLSIDIDGSDYWVWEAITSYRPRVVIVEYNSAIDPRRRLVQPKSLRGWDESEYYGASLGSLQTLGEDKGYRLVHTELSGVNAFFVRSDLVGESFPAPEDVAKRGVPNYFQRGYHHRPADPDSRYLDLDSGELVSAGEAHA